MLAGLSLSKAFLLFLLSSEEEREGFDSSAQPGLDS
jgi:hypothetical protein